MWRVPTAVPAFQAFLSHRYKSPAVNEYFFDILSDSAEMIFDVDDPDGATNVTRLERMMRACHGFIAIYPFVPDPKLAGAPLRQQRRKAARYFQLEMGLAARARRPALVYADRRFGSDLDLPPTAFFAEFDHEEVTAAAGSPNRDLFRDVFARFVNRVRAGMAYDATCTQAWRTDRVGVLLPSESPYDPAMRDRLCGCISDLIGEPQIIPWPRAIDSSFIGAVHECDWVVTDIASCEAVGLLGFLEGRFVPLIRLLHVAPDADRANPSPAEATLYGAFEVGYVKDIVRWSGAEELEREVRARLSRIQQDTRHIVKRDDARAYFREAALRKEAVFISYSGADSARARPIIDSFRQKFQRVFDYKDGESIAAGRPWLDEIFTTLERSSLAILLLSPSYFTSGNCEHEARAAIAQRDGHKLEVLPVRLTEATDPPAWLKDLQNLRFVDDGDPSIVLKRALALLPPL